MPALSNPRDMSEAGPSPLGRAVAGLLLGAVAGAVAALLTPRRSPHAADSTASVGSVTTPS